jgi:membrane-associated HD superfamily phosphohydrolase
MEKGNNLSVIGRILRISIFSQSLIIIAVYAFTKSAIYCIITLLATLIGISSFLIMIKLVDRLIKRKTGRVLFFVFSFLKIALIVAVFYPLSRISESAILFYMLGLSTIVISTLIEGAYQIYRTLSNGRT